MRTPKKVQEFVAKQLQKNKELSQKERFGSLFIQEKVGEGSISTVYTVTRDQSRKKMPDPNPPLQALKVMKPFFLSDEHVRERFIKEALTLIPITHPNIIDLQSIVVHKDHIALLMEYIDGPTLKQWKETHTLINRKKFIHSLCAAIDTLHSLGIIHRDIKPENILIREDQSPCLIDLGIAKTDKNLLNTTVGTFLGTLSYAPVEQINGEEITHTIDLYALGIVIYEMLTGTLPWPSQSKFTKIFAVKELGLYTHIQEHLPSLSASEANAIMKLLSQEPSERFSSAMDFFHELYQEKERTTIPLPTSTKIPHVAPLGILGVGGCGCNMLTKLHNHDNTMAFNSDVQHLRTIQAQKIISLGSDETNCLGTGGNIGLAQAIVFNNMSLIESHIQPYDCILLLAGMGGGMGTGALPLFAKKAKELQKFVVACVAMPFFFEGKKRKQQALKGQQELLPHCDILISFSNDALIGVEDCTLQESFLQINLLIEKITSQMDLYLSQKMSPQKIRQQISTLVQDHPALCTIHAS